MARNFDLVRAAKTTPELDWSAYFGAGGAFTLTVNGREAIDLALNELRLRPDDEVLIVTTTGGPYISRCVTDLITARCRWSRAPGPRTRAIFLIHEFGFPAALSAELLALGLPIIEDCAYALGTAGAGGVGDYVVYSFSKALPLPYGGLLKSPRPPARASLLSGQARHETPILLDPYLRGRQAAFTRRREVFEIYRERFAAEGLSPLLTPEPGTVPHSFLVALEDQARAEAMRPKLHAAGIISSVFFGGGGYFLPNHQSLSDAAIDYIVAQFMAAWHGG